MMNNSANSDQRNLRCVVCAVLLWVCQVQSASADTRVIVQSASDWIYHGTTETFSQATLGFNAEWQSNASYFLGVEGHQAVTPDVQQRHRSIMAYAGYSWPLGESWHASTVVAGRYFPGSFKEWDYTEYKLEFAHQNGFNFKLDYAPNYYHHETEAIIGELGFSGEFSNRQYWYVSGGGAALSADRFSNYQYARIGTGLSHSRFNFDVSYGWNSRDGEGLFGSEQIRSPGILLQLSHQLR